jgi:hypothetical protein
MDGEEQLKTLIEQHVAAIGSARAKRIRDGQWQHEVLVRTQMTAKIAKQDEGKDCAAVYEDEGKDCEAVCEDEGKDVHSKVKQSTRMKAKIAKLSTRMKTKMSIVK